MKYADGKYGRSMDLKSVISETLFPQSFESGELESLRRDVANIKEFLIGRLCEEVQTEFSLNRLAGYDRWLEVPE